MTRVYSIGWRMGYGEHYLWLFEEWFASLDAAVQDAYRARWSPADVWEDYWEPISDDEM